jgi:PAS domain S-box-containing protein
MYLAEILTRYRERIIDEWIHRLRTEVSERYSRRPTDELLETVSRANDASFTVLVDNDLSAIDAHIEWITNIRLEGGFSLSEVQNAYELYRTILCPIFIQELAGADLLSVLQRLDQCLFYTITRFSNYFQSQHEKQIRDHALGLEHEVETRTKELAESEAKYRVLVEEINDGYFVNQGNIVFANKAFCDLHGYTIQEVVGRPYTDFVAPNSLPAVKELYDRRASGEDSQDLYGYFRRHKDGSFLPTENKVKRILYEGQYAVAGICRDITERTETEKRIREAERLAHIGKLTTSLAHEIRNPLSSVKMNSQIILKNTEFNGNDKRRMEIIVHEISRLERILDEMLDFARPLRLNFESASINDIVGSCLEIIGEKFRENNIAVRRRYSLKIPFIPVDREKIEQAIINIFLNSIEALPEGGTVEVTTTQEQRGKRSVMVQIRDNGPGISKEDLPYIFDPFFSNKKKGTGLGLSNVSKIIEAHGGEVKVASRKPVGLQVCLHLPVSGA